MSHLLCSGLLSAEHTDTPPTPTPPPGGFLFVKRDWFVTGGIVTVITSTFTRNKLTSVLAAELRYLDQCMVWSLKPL